MQALAVLLALLLVLGGAAKREEAKVKQRVDLRVEVDSKGNTSSTIGIGTEYKDPDSGVRVIIQGGAN